MFIQSKLKESFHLQTHILITAVRATVYSDD